MKLNETIIINHDQSQLALSLCRYNESDSGLLTADEKILCNSLIPGRRAGFTTSRIALKHSLRKLELPEFSCLEHGSPQGLGKELIFSLSHKDDYGVAIAIKPNDGSSTVIKSAGADIEILDQEFDKSGNAERLLKRIASESEKDLLKTIHESQLAVIAIRLFSIKESVFKAYHNSFKTSLAFNNIDIEFADQDKFLAKVLDTNEPAATLVISGGFFTSGNLLISYAVLSSI